VSYAQELYGRTPRYLGNASNSSDPSDWVAVAMGLPHARQATSGVTESMDFQVQASAFHDLAKGGPPCWEVEALLYQGGKKFRSTDKTYMPVTFRQAH
jgi:hypothetical protein